MSLLFSGPINVYLEGQDALEILDSNSDDHIAYAVGAASSAIKVIDWRADAIAAARCALRGEDTVDFADKFNTPSWIELSAADDNSAAEIVIRKPATGKIQSTLWLGVLDGDWITAHDTEWELFRVIDQDHIAFASIIP